LLTKKGVTRLISRATVWTVLNAGTPTVPWFERAKKVEPLRGGLWWYNDANRWQWRVSTPGVLK
jgi:hypothetical protein